MKKQLVIIMCTLFFVTCKVQSAKVEVSYYAQNKLIQLVGSKRDNNYLFQSSKNNKQVKLATLNWPPYIGQQVCDLGWVFQFTVALLHSKGYDVKITFLPWARAVRMVELGDYDALFPEYFIEKSAPSDNVKGASRRDVLALSHSYLGGNISFLKRTGEADSFAGNLTNMIGQRIGVVRGYQNTPEFDAMMDKGQFQIMQAIDDFQLVRLLLRNRVDYIIGDPEVLRTVVRFSTSLESKQKYAMLNSFEQVQPAIQYNPLYFALSKRKTNWQSLLADINSGIEEFSENKELNRIIEDSKSRCFMHKEPIVN